jgi:uncharacterized RDD family membrane protein YckC
MGPPQTKFNPPVGSSIKVEAAPKKNMAEELSDYVEPEAGAEAPFQQRLFAVLIDLAVGVGLVISAKILLPDSAEGIVGNILLVGYLLTRDALPFLGGRSIGKMAMKLQAVTLEDKSLSGNWKASIIRNISVVFPPGIGAGVEAFLLNSRQNDATLRRLGDEFAKTKVLYVGDEPIKAEGQPSAVTSSPVADEPVEEKKQDDASSEGVVLDAKVRRD